MCLCAVWANASMCHSYAILLRFWAHKRARSMLFSPYASMILCHRRTHSMTKTTQLHFGWRFADSSLRFDCVCKLYLFLFIYLLRFLNLHQSVSIPKDRHAAKWPISMQIPPMDVLKITGSVHEETPQWTMGSGNHGNRPSSGELGELHTVKPVNKRPSL